MWLIYRNSGDYGESSQDIIGFSRDEETAKLSVEVLEQTANRLSDTYSDIWQEWYNSDEYESNDSSERYGPIWEKCHELSEKLLNSEEYILVGSKDAVFGYFKVEEINV